MQNLWWRWSWISLLSTSKNVCYSFFFAWTNLFVTPPLRPRTVRRAVIAAQRPVDELWAGVMIQEPIWGLPWLLSEHISESWRMFVLLLRGEWSRTSYVYTKVVLPRSLGKRTSFLIQQERTKTGVVARVEVGSVLRLVLENRKLPNFKEHNTRSHFLRHVDE